MSSDTINEETGTYRIALRPSPSEGIPGFRAVFGRINVILGANGTGKSRLIVRLRAMNNAFGAIRPVIFIEGGRVLAPPPSVSLNRETIDGFRDVQMAGQQHRNLQQSALAERVRHAFLLLARKGDEGKSQHSDAVTAWLESNRKGEVPVRREPPLEKLFRLFREVFPEIEIAVEGALGLIRCQKNGSTYSVQELSDGERQVLVLLADIALLAEPNSLVLVDEPELNLNTNLACRLWDSLEANLPNAVFVYATHSLGFAMRSNVEHLIVLSGGGHRYIEVADVSKIPVGELREFLGAIPAILAAPAALVVEGDESSLDPPFYWWLLERRDLVIAPVGGSENVSAAVRRVGVWERLAPSAQVVGVVDRDYRSDAVIASLEAADTVPLHFHEVESYFCWPQLLADLSSKIGIVEPPLTTSEVEKAVLLHLEENALHIAALRTFARVSINLAVSIPKSVLRGFSTEDELRAALRGAAQSERAKVDEALGGDVTERIFDEELARVREVLRNRAITDALVLVPGKELLGTMLHRTGCRSPQQAIRAATKHLSPADYQPLRELRKAILTKLAAVQSGESKSGMTMDDEWPPEPRWGPEAGGQP